MIRHLWNLMLENILDLSSLSRPNITVPFWRNLIFIVFYTQEIISSAHIDSIKQSVNYELENQNITLLRNYFFKLNPEEDFPYSINDKFNF